MNTYDNATHPGVEAEQAFTAVRLTALRRALSHSGAATAALIDMSAALADAGVSGLAWDTDHLNDRIAAVAGEIAHLIKTEAERTAQEGAAR